MKKTSVIIGKNQRWFYTAHMKTTKLCSNIWCFFWWWLVTGEARKYNIKSSSTFYFSSVGSSNKNSNGFLPAIIITR